jgi:Tol biopolymer transport system component
LVWVDGQGNEAPLPLPVRQYYGPRLSPDGDRVAVSVFDGESWDLWVYNVRSGAGLRLTRGDGVGTPAMVPVWTPEGGRIVFGSLNPETGIGDVYWIAADGSGTPEPLVASDTTSDFSTSVSANGSLIFSRIFDPGPNTHREVWEVPLDGDRTATPLLRGEFAYANASLSPDGRWLAYVSDESGVFDIYLQPYPGPGPKTPVSIGGGGELVWSPDGSEIFYRLGSAVMAVEVESVPTLSVSEPRVLFQSNHLSAGGGGVRQYHVAPDGRFLMIRSGAAEGGEPADYDHLIVVENWLDELQRLVPSN